MYEHTETDFHQSVGMLLNGSGNGVLKRQRLTGTAKRQRKNGNGMVETGHHTGLRNLHYSRQEQQADQHWTMASSSFVQNTNAKGLEEHRYAF